MAAFTLALALMVSAPVAQDPTANEKDARCTVALQGMADTIDDAGGKAAVSGVMLFFLGRLSARLDPSQIEGVIDEAGANLSKDDYRQVGLDCVEQMRVLSGAGSAS